MTKTKCKIFVPEYLMTFNAIQVDYDMEDWDRDNGLLYDLGQEVLTGYVRFPENFSVECDREQYAELLEILQECEGKVYVFLINVLDDILLLAFGNAYSSEDVDILTSFELRRYK